MVAYPASGFAGKGFQVATEDLTYQMQQAHDEATELRDEATALRDEATALRIRQPGSGIMDGKIVRWN